MLIMGKIDFGGLAMLAGIGLLAYLFVIKPAQEKAAAEKATSETAKGISDWFSGAGKSLSDWWNSLFGGGGAGGGGGGADGTTPPPEGSLLSQEEINRLAALTQSQTFKETMARLPPSTLSGEGLIAAYNPTKATTYAGIPASFSPEKIAQMNQIAAATGGFFSNVKPPVVVAAAHNSPPLPTAAATIVAQTQPNAAVQQAAAAELKYYAPAGATQVITSSGTIITSAPGFTATTMSTEQYLAGLGLK